MAPQLPALTTINGSTTPPPPPAPPPPTRSSTTITPSPLARRKVTILITGFGPFQDRFPVNPSFEIPTLLPRALTLNTIAAGEVDVNLIHYPHPIRVCYSSVRTLVPLILEAYSSRKVGPGGALEGAGGEVDMVLHMGMASGRDFYTLELQAHRDGYDRNKDLDGEILPPDHGEVAFGDCPELMRTSLDYDGILDGWKGNIRRRRSKVHPSVVVQGLEVDEADCRPSDDAGHYLCDYIYLNSLAWFGRRSRTVVDGMPEDRPVLFLHVPAESDEQALEKGRVVTLALIESMVERWLDRTNV